MGIIDLVVSLLKPFMFVIMAVLDQFNLVHNCKVVDASGKTINATKVDGKIYPPFGESRIRNIPKVSIRHDDVLLCGFPKTGCHWMYEVISMLLKGKVKLSRHGKVFGGMIDAVPQIMLALVPSPRVLNTHVLYEGLPTEVWEKKNKIILTVRNPKDTVVSYYNHVTNLKSAYGYDGSFNDFFDLFIEGKLEYGDYFDHLLDWEKRMKSQNCNQILMVSFEDLKADPLKCVHKVAEFLEVKVTDDFASEVVEACSFKKMKKKRARDGQPAKLFRKGKEIKLVLYK